jgi:hypothetical protein
MASATVASEEIFGDISPSSSSSAGRFVDDEEDDGGSREVRKLEAVDVKCGVLWSSGVAGLSGCRLQRR